MANSAVVGILRALLTADTAQFQSGMKSAATQARAWQKDFSSIGQQATAAGRTLTAGLTLPILGLGAASVKSFMDFQDSFTGVRKTVNASGPEFEAMAQQFRDLAKTIPINVNELNRLGEAAGALGIPKAQVVEFARVMALLGVTTNLTSEQAAESIAKIQNIFGAAGQDTDRFAATLVALGNDGASTETQIVEMAARIAGAGNAVNMTQGQVLAFASALSSVGIEAEMGGSAISRVFINIASAVRKGGDDVQGFARVAGMSIKDFSQKFQTDAAGAVNAFIQGLNGVKTSGGDLIGTIEQLGFTEIRVRDTLLRAAGAGDVLTRALALQGKAWSENRALTDEAATRFATMKSQLQLLWNQLRDVGITIGGALKPSIEGLIAVVKSLLPYVQSAAKWFEALPPGLQTSIVGFLALAAAVGPVMFVFGQLMTGGGTLLALFTKKGIVMRALAAAFTFATAPAVGFTGAMTALNAAMIANPWTAALLALGGLVIAYKAAAKAVDEHTEAERGAARQATYGYGTYALQAQAIDKVTDALKRKNDELNKGAAGPGMSLNQYQSKEQADAQRQAEYQKNLDEIAKRGQKAAAALAQLSEAQKKNNDEIKRLARELSGANLDDELKLLADTVKSLGGISGVSKYQLEQLGKTLAEKVSQGARLGDAALFAIWLQHERLNPSIRVTTDAYEDLASILKNLPPMRNIAPPPIALPVSLGPIDVTKFGQQLGGLPPPPQIVGFGARLGAALGGSLIGAIQNGNIGSAVASSLGTALFANGSGLNSLLNNGLFSLARRVGGGFAANLATSLSAAIPGIGALLGPALAQLGSRLIGWIGGLGGNSTRDAREQLARMLGFPSLAAMNDALRGMGAEGAALVEQGLNRIGRNDTAANNAWMARVRTLFEDIAEGANEAAQRTVELQDNLAGLQSSLADLQARSQPTWQDMLDAAREFGIEICGLGAAFQQQRLDAEATRIWNAFDTLRRGGADINAVLAGMSDELQAFILESLKFGTTVPENMRPMLQSLIDQGQLVDENGERLTDLSRIRFGDPVKSEWEKVEIQIRKLTDAIAAMVRLLGGEVIDTVGDVVKAFRNLPTEWEFEVKPNFGSGGVGGGAGGSNPKVPGFSKGTNGQYVDFGSGTLAMLHGRERVMTENELRGGGSGEGRLLEIPVIVQGEEIARAAFPHLVFVSKDLGY